MKVGYKKDLKHNYMVITELENIKSQSYCTKILELQSIKGILSLEQRLLNNESLIYYDITAKQSMAAIYDKASLTKDKLKQLCMSIISIIELAYEFLLPEDDFILDPEYIYMNIGTGEPFLCYLPGYEKNIKKQMSNLMEYLMNKVDYSDKGAVLLVYQLYAVSREEGYTFNHLREELQDYTQPKQEKMLTNLDKSVESIDQYNQLQDTNSGSFIDTRFNTNQERNNNQTNEESIRSKKATPEVTDNNQSRMILMKEKLENDEEVPCYSITTYLLTAGSIIGGLIIIIASLITKILYNSYGDQIDYIKLVVLLLIVFCVEGYCLKKIWDKKNKITKIVARNEYVDPRKIMKSFDKRKLLLTKPGEITQDKLSESNRMLQLNLKNKDENSKNKLHINKVLNFQDSLPDVKTRLNQRTVSEESTTSEGSEKIQEHTITMKKLYQRNEVTPSRYNSFNEDMQNLNEPDNPTCLLNAPSQQNYSNSTVDHQYSCILKALDEVNYQPIQIKDFPFFIGKLKKNVDYCLEKAVVSRYHAKITKEEDDYFITDLNSTNGTFVNGIALQTYEKKKVESGDEIAFANINYRFELTTEECNVKNFM